jgi:hypothetical protein
VISALSLLLGLATLVPGLESDSISGVYRTAVTLTTTTCGPIQVENNPTVVAYDSASHGLTLTHAGTSYIGRLTPSDSSFVTTPKVVDINDGHTYTIAITGRFTREGFVADATVDRTTQLSGEACRFTVHWVGTDRKP